jgi:thimet oligopeptidase
MTARALLASLLLAAHGFACAGDGVEPFVFPKFESAGRIESSCTALIDQQKAHAARLEAMAPGAAVLGELDELMLRYEDLLGPLAVLAAAHPDKAIRDAAEACELRYQEFSTAFLQNARVHALIAASPLADPIDARMQRDLLDSFEDSGVALAPEAQARARAIATELTDLTQLFDRRIREENSKVAFAVAELAGVPAAVWKGAPRDAQGRVLLGLDYPSYDPVMAHARSGAARERMWRAFQNIGGDANLATLTRIGALRREYAQLFGFGSYADFVLRRRMAQRAADVEAFLATVKGAVAEREIADLGVLRAAKAKALRQPRAATVVHRWDVSYYTEKARRATFKVSQDAFRRHFPPRASLDFVFALATELFGVRLEPIAQPLWHRDALAFAVSDRASGQLIGKLFTDLYPRADKYGHAAVWSFRSGSQRAGRLPAAALIVNFNRKGLSIDELETLLHEFGHALHSLLSNTRYASQAGTSVQLDFVEAPSQMLEAWVYDPKVLALFQRVCKACPPVPAKMLRQADRARHFAKGIQYARQHLYASYDLAFYGSEAQDPLALWARMEGATPLGHERGTRFPAGFSHSASNYAAGYYGYLWSLAIAEDLRTAFGASKLDGATGRRYRETILANGGQVAPGELVQRFLGRPSDSRAFFDFLRQD